MCKSGGTCNRLADAPDTPATVGAEMGQIIVLQGTNYGATIA
jgi:hypothetical protein